MNRLKGIRRNWFISAVIVLGILFLGFTSPGRAIYGTLDGILLTATSPIQRSFSGILARMGGSISEIPNLGTLARDYYRLEEENRALALENQNLKDIISRSPQLTNAYRLKQKKWKTVPARVIQKNEGFFFDRIGIDVGTRDGISQGDTVVVALSYEGGAAPEGLVGYVEEAGPFTSKVRTIIDENNAVSFRSIRTLDGGIVQGRDHQVHGYAYDLYADLVPDDDLITSGLGDLYAPGIYIGKVQKVVNDETTLVKNLVVTPAVDFKKLYEVHVITEAPRILEGEGEMRPEELPAEAQGETAAQEEQELPEAGAQGNEGPQNNPVQEGDDQ
ncbi:MAG: rod shape-determining protein MreC [Tissierellia bacterium]|nr:rod shape-determining protein MreC [Tissierellia bacterium]